MEGQFSAWRRLGVAANAPGKKRCDQNPSTRGRFTQSFVVLVNSYSWRAAGRPRGSMGSDMYKKMALLDIQQQSSTVLMVCALVAGAVAGDLVYDRYRGTDGVGGLAELGMGPYGYSHGRFDSRGFGKVSGHS
ncbi:hypothetical protein ElyMa_000258400 [Elysia marginata]|uniref:Uncharacterized protein n=1 Tax=Elysia marginata TaxID=1093978 RepID=A0AAV4F4V1_9GAST|nr:hypothetical protein ElyMa_000258400 [Elysia marginata]